MTVTTLDGFDLELAARRAIPTGFPAPDQVPLLALLRATPLTEEQVQEVVRNIAEVAAPADIEDPITRDDIEASISEVTNHDARTGEHRAGWRNWLPRGSRSPTSPDSSRLPPPWRPPCSLACETLASSVRSSAQASSNRLPGLALGTRLSTLLSHFGG